MLIKREKCYTVWGDTLDWAKKFTPRIPLSENSNLFILWPGTLVGAIVGFLKGLVTKFKHVTNGRNSKQSTDHDSSGKSHQRIPEEKQFSDIPLDSNYYDYCKSIPGYKEISELNTINFDLLDKLSESNKKYIWKYFPSFLVVSNPEKINEYRKDFINKSNEDYSEIIFMFGNELVLMWDFDKESWYVRDNTYSPYKEWKIDNNTNILDYLKRFFNPKEDQLLEQRLKKWEENPELSKYFNMRKYCEIMSVMINKVRQDFSSQLIIRM